MSVRCIPAASVAVQPWRNGGGRTRELFAWPSADDWRLRISLADIDADGPFSAFDDTQRWFAVIEGGGVALVFDAEREHRLVVGDAPLCFDGAEAPGCRLLDGPTRDLNLMLRNGHGAMRPVDAAAPWQEDFAMRGLFARLGGRWTGANASAHVSPRTLLWDDAAERSGSAWRFEPDEADAAPAGWWLGFTPEEALP